MGSVAYNMNGTIQDTDKTMLNMYSVHRFFLEILEEMQAIVTSDQQKNYMLNWEPKLAITFINVTHPTFRQSNTISINSPPSSLRSLKNIQKKTSISWTTTVP